MNNFSVTHECIREVHNFGHTIFYNICDGTINVVSWGVLDWLLAIVGLLAMIGLFIIIFKMVVDF